MRGDDQQQNHIFSYLSPEERVRKDHRCAPSERWWTKYLLNCRGASMRLRWRGPPIDPAEKLLRAQLIQMLSTVRSERLLMEEIDYSLLFRWFVGMNLDEQVWDAAFYREPRPLAGGRLAKEFLSRCSTSAGRKPTWTNILLLTARCWKPGPA